MYIPAAPQIQKVHTKPFRHSAQLPHLHVLPVRSHRVSTFFPQGIKGLDKRAYTIIERSPGFVGHAAAHWSCDSANTCIGSVGGVSRVSGRGRKQGERTQCAVEPRLVASAIG